tara:strand:- start:201 stop:1559 length:1359 start_codon:yes stop_codon:yes gene_type:complete
MNRPGKVTEPIAIRKWGKGASGPSGTATPRFAQKTTTAEALPFDSYDAAVEADGVSAPVTTTTQGALEGFDDNRGGIRKFIDSLSGRQSTADALNAQLAIGRDTTAQQLAGNLAVGKQGDEAAFARQAAQLTGQGENQRALQTLESSNRLKELPFTTAADIEKTTAQGLMNRRNAEQVQMTTGEQTRLTNAELAKQSESKDILAGRIALATHLKVPHDRLSEMSDAQITSALEQTGALTAEAQQKSMLATRTTAALGNLPNSHFTRGAAGLALKPEAEIIQKYNTAVGPNEAVFNSLSGTRTYGLTPERKDLMGLGIPDTGSPASQVIGNPAQDKLDALRAAAAAAKPKVPAATTAAPYTPTGFAEYGDPAAMQRQLARESLTPRVAGVQANLEALKTKLRRGVDVAPVDPESTITPYAAPFTTAQKVSLQDEFNTKSKELADLKRRLEANN